MGCQKLISNHQISTSKLSVVWSKTDYDFIPPFGMLMPGRHSTSESYRYGFQGQESDDEIKGNGNSLNYKYRMHDPRLGRFFAVDPLAAKYPDMTPYQFAANQVIHGRELEGLENENPLGYSNAEALIDVHKPIAKAGYSYMKAAIPVVTFKFTLFQANVVKVSRAIGFVEVGVSTVEKNAIEFTFSTDPDRWCAPNSEYSDGLVDADYRPVAEMKTGPSVDVSFLIKAKFDFKLGTLSFEGAEGVNSKDVDQVYQKIKVTLEKQLAIIGFKVSFEYKSTDDETTIKAGGEAALTYSQKTSANGVTTETATSKVGVALDAEVVISDGE